MTSVPETHSTIIAKNALIAMMVSRADAANDNDNDNDINAIVFAAAMEAAEIAVKTSAFAENAKTEAAIAKANLITIISDVESTNDENADEIVSAVLANANVKADNAKAAIIEANAYTKYANYVISVSSNFNNM